MTLAKTNCPTAGAASWRTGGKGAKTETFWKSNQNEQPGWYWCERGEKSEQKFDLRKKCHVIDSNPQWPKKLNACTQIDTLTLILITEVPLMFLCCLMTACCQKHVCGVFKVLQSIQIKAMLAFFFKPLVQGFIFSHDFFSSKAFVFENSNPIDASPLKQYCRRGSIAAPHPPVAALRSHPESSMQTGEP